MPLFFGAALDLRHTKPRKTLLLPFNNHLVGHLAIPHVYANPALHENPVLFALS
jgi:hypothetical protein